jgi:hypothetical protein
MCKILAWDQASISNGKLNCSQCFFSCGHACPSAVPNNDVWLSSSGDKKFH